MNEAEINVAFLGIHPSNTGNQNSDAWDAAMAAIPITVRFGGEKLAIGQRWFLGSGVYRFSRTCEINRSMSIEGNLGYGATTFIFPSGVTGIVVHSHQSSGGAFAYDGGSGTFYVGQVVTSSGGATGVVTEKIGDSVSGTLTVKDLVGEFMDGQTITGPISGMAVVKGAFDFLGNNGNYTVLKNLLVRASGKTTTAHGVSVKGYGVELTNVYAQLFAGNGFHFNGSTQDKPATICIHWKMDRCRADSNGGHGLYVNGGDSSSGQCFGFDAFGNGGWGILDSSGTGNSYSGIQTQTNALGPYLMGGANSGSVLVNPYAESDQTASLVNAPALVIGGVHPGGQTGTGGYSSGGGDTKPFTVIPKGAGPSGSIGIGVTNGLDTLSYLECRNSDDSGSLYFQYGGGHSAGFGSKWYGFNHSNGDGKTCLQLAGENAQLTSWPMSVDGGRVAFDSQGFFLNQNRIKNSHAIPTTDTYNVGDIILDTEPVAGGRQGWVCVDSGTQGVYAEGRTATTDGTAFVVLDLPSAALRVGDVITINATARRIVAISGVNLTMSGPIATMAASQPIVYAHATFQEFGHVAGGAGDSTAAPGDATLNALNGRSTIAAESISVVITNDKATPTSVIHATLQTLDATLTAILVVAPGDGSFRIVGNAAATDAVTVCWSVEE